jgi:hypothetical protein
MNRITSLLRQAQGKNFSAPKRLALNDMLRKFKLAGAHPDIIWGIDAQKAQQNGETMIRLESLLHARANGSKQQQVSADPESFTFWLPTRIRGAPESLTSVTSVISPAASPVLVKDQLSRLFRSAGLHDDFDLGGERVEANLESVLHKAEANMVDHTNRTQPLNIRAEKSINRLRQFGVLIVISDNDKDYLVTPPELPSGSVVTSVNDQESIDPDFREYLDERGLQGFDIRLAGTYTAVENLVTAFERIEAIYEQHRGLALRTGVCIVIHLNVENHYIAQDGCIVLTIKKLATWEEFLLSQPQDVWRSCVELHKQWRHGAAPKHEDLRRKLLRIADAFNFFSFNVEVRLGQQTSWQEELVNKLHRDEPTVRAALKKYNITSPTLRQRGHIIVKHRLTSQIQQGKEIMFRVQGDGKLLLSSQATTPQMLKALKDNIKVIEAAVKDYTLQMATLEHLSRSVPIDFNIDLEWRRANESSLVSSLERFVSTIKENQVPLRGFLTTLLAKGAQSPVSDNMTIDQKKDVQRRSISMSKMLWVISDHFDIMPSGVVFVPWNVDFESIKRMLLAPSAAGSGGTITSVHRSPRQ